MKYVYQVEVEGYSIFFSSRKKARNYVKSQIKGFSDIEHMRCGSIELFYGFKECEYLKIAEINKIRMH